MACLYVDGCCNKTTSSEAWASVCNESGEDLIKKYSNLYSDLEYKQVTVPKGDKTIIVAKSTDVASQQNNFGELLAMVFALRISKIEHTKIIYSDSQLIVVYWSKNHINPKTRAKMDPKKLAYINECSDLRKEFEKNGGKIEQISGDDNLADLGYHK